MRLRFREDPELPVRIHRAGPAWPLHDLAGTRALESRWLAREPDGALMRRAGTAVARWISALAPHARHIWVACGPGGNGGDGLHAAAMLARRGVRVSVSLHADPRTLSGDASQGLQAAREAGARIDSAPPKEPADVAVDALLGIGARPDPGGALLDGARALGRSSARRLAIDLPTGLDPWTGVRSRHGQVTADATLALLTLRPGMFTGHGRDACGEIWLDTLGADRDAIWLESSVARLTSRQEHPACWVLRPHASHKGRFGDVHVVGGAPGLGGAARLAALAASSAGAGRTLITLLDPAAPLLDASHAEWIWRSLEDLDAPGSIDRVTMVCGCGAGTTLDQRLGDWLERVPRVVLDADALNTLARQRALADALRARHARGQPSILTPHPLEAARLLAVDTTTVQSDRMASARQLAELFRATVVLKGSGTVIATPGQTTAVNATGGPALATAGSGDVLAGWIGGLWAQTCWRADKAQEEERGERGDDEEGRSASATAHATACSAAWLHGRAADRSGLQAVLRASDLVEAMRTEPPPDGSERDSVDRRFRRPVSNDLTG